MLATLVVAAESMLPKLFPKLMILNRGVMVLFTGNASYGTCISDPTGYHRIGDYRDNWGKKLFKDFTGEVILKQE